jgi:hypothetical protein
VLKAFYNNNNEIVLQAGPRSKAFPASQFEDSIFLDGLFCPKKLCEITSTEIQNGSQAATAEAD